MKRQEPENLNFNVDVIARKKIEPASVAAERRSLPQQPG
jgi:hypothetical protein